MKNTTKRRAALTAASAGAVALTALAGPANATNGYFANGYGGGSKGMAGAGVAVPAGVLGLAQNPAMGLELGNRAGLCLTLFSPRRSFEASGASPVLIDGTYDSNNEFFPIPCGGVNYMLNSESSIGIIAFGNGGMNTEYDDNVFLGGSSPLGVNLEQLFIQVNYSRRLNEELTFGIGPVFALQRFSATGLELFDNGAFSSNPGSVTNNGDDWSSGAGVNVGVLWEPNENWNFGFAYRSRVYMEEFNKYSGLFAEQGDFDIPAVATIGAAYTLPSQPALTLTAEYQRIFYGDVASISNTGATTTALAAGLGSDDGAGFGWEDMDIVRIGAVYKQSDKLTLRGGVSYATQFIDGDEVLFNTLAPATPQWHVSVGGSYQLNDRWGITASYTHILDATVSGANPVGLVGDDIDLQMVQDELAIGMTYRW